MQTNCPCGSKLPYQLCCGSYINGGKFPPTPEALMRSRYTAYTRANIKYIMETMKAPANKGFDPVAAEEWALQAVWQGLTVLNAPPVAGDATQGFVEFIAEYLLAGKKQTIHEISEFKLQNGRWYYVKGQYSTKNSHKKTR